MHWWQVADEALFFWINTGLTNPFFDTLLPMVREKWLWAPLYLFIAAFAWQNLPSRKRIVFVLGLVLAAGLSDFTSSTLIKKNVQRLRPCNEPRLEAQVIERIPCGSGYSFTSSHASNHFAVATFVGLALGHLSRWWQPLLLGWAFLIAFAQVYVGVHYPGDVLGGGVLGTAIGGWAFSFLKRTRLF